MACSPLASQAYGAGISASVNTVLGPWPRHADDKTGSSDIQMSDGRVFREKWPEVL